MKYIKELIASIIRDTLKKADNNTGEYRWSRTSLTMLSSWIAALFLCFYDYFKTGVFKYDVFLTLVLVAVSVKAVDALSQRLVK